MIGLALDQLLAMVAMLVLLGVPGWAVGRLTSAQLAVPQIALPPVWFVFGLAVWTVSLCVALTFGLAMHVTVVVHAAVSVALAAWALLRDGRRGHAKPGWGRVEAWSIGGVAACTLLAAALRTRLAFDTLFHVGLVRRLAELHHPHFDSIDRIWHSGVNPAYVVPAWQGAMGAVATVTGVDPATAVEAMAAVAVLLAACAAGALGRVVGGRASAEVAGVAAFAFLRVWFPRRELEGDGVAYAAIPGNLALDILLPLVLVAAILFVRRTRGDVGRPRTLVAIAGLSSALIVVLHANYVVYLAAIGIGAVAWMALTTPRAVAPWRRMGGLIAAIAVPGALALGALLPALVLLDHFGAPAEQRITYHLVGRGAWQIIRPGHYYDWFAAPGLLAVLALPFAVRRLRGVRQAIVGGGVTALLAIGLVPPLLDLVGQSGSLTLGLRIARPFGVLLVASSAVAIPLAVDPLRARVERFRTARGDWPARLARVAPFVVLLGVVGLYGYPLARREPAQYGWNWPTLVAVAGLLAVLALELRTRRSALAEDALPRLADEPDPRTPAATTPPPTRKKSDPPQPMRDVRAVGFAVLALAVCLLPSGAVSLRHGAYQGRQFVASSEADDLGCAAGIQRGLRHIPAGATILADPVTAYDVQALAPGFVIGDYKTWNGATDSKRANARVEQLRDAFDTEDEHATLHAIEVLRDQYHPTWLVVADGDVEPPLGSTIGTFDAIGLRRAIADGVVAATLEEHGAGRLPSSATDDERAACSLSLYELPPVVVDHTGGG